MTKPHEYVDTASEVLKATGWCVGELGKTRITTPDEDGEHCAIGALAAARFIHDGKGYGSEYAAGDYRSNYAKAVRAVYDALPKAHRKRMERFADERINDYVRINAIVSYNDGDLADLDEDAGKSKLLRIYRKASKALQS